MHAFCIIYVCGQNLSCISSASLCVVPSSAGQITILGFLNPPLLVRNSGIATPSTEVASKLRTGTSASCLKEFVQAKRRKWKGKVFFQCHEVVQKFTQAYLGRCGLSIRSRASIPEESSHFLDCGCTGT